MTPWTCAYVISSCNKNSTRDGPNYKYKMRNNFGRFFIFVFHHANVYRDFVIPLHNKANITVVRICSSMYVSKEKEGVGEILPEKLFNFRTSLELFQSIFESISASVPFSHAIFTRWTAIFTQTNLSHAMWRTGRNHQALARIQCTWVIFMDSIRYSFHLLSQMSMGSLNYLKIS